MQQPAETLTVSYCGPERFPDIRNTLLGIYAEVYAEEMVKDPFFSVEQFADRLDRHAAGPRWGCALAEVDGRPVGYAYGFARTAAYQWNGLLTDVPAEILRETDHRTFAFCEVMVREPWQGRGVARTLHDELLARRNEERSHLLVERGHPRVRALYERWGYQWMGEMRPVPGAPLYDSMLKAIPRYSDHWQSHRHEHWAGQRGLSHEG